MELIRDFQTYILKFVTSHSLTEHNHPTDQKKYTVAVNEFSSLVEKTNRKMISPNGLQTISSSHLTYIMNRMHDRGI